MVKPVDNLRNVLHKGHIVQVEMSEAFAKWLTLLRDRKARARVVDRIRRLADGNFGDTKSIGGGVHELRMFFGPGYRIYYMYRGDVVILLLIGGDKSSQGRDIAKAKELADQERYDNQDDTL